MFDISGVKEKYSYGKYKVIFKNKSEKIWTNKQIKEAEIK